MRKFILLAAMTGLTACSTVTEPQGGPPMALVNGSGQSIGSVRAWQTAGGVSFHIEASGLPHGIHGVHVHAVGRCDGPDFASAGGHWNPAGKKHGMNNPAGPHAGDMPNVEVAANGVLGTTVVAARREHGEPARRRRCRSRDPRRTGRLYDRPQRQQRRPDCVRGDPARRRNPLIASKTDQKLSAGRGLAAHSWVKCGMVRHLRIACRWLNPPSPMTTMLASSRAASSGWA